MYPPHHYGGYELVWQSAVEHLRTRGDDVEVLTTDTLTGSREPDPPHVHRDLRWHLRGTDFERLGPVARTTMARHNHRVLDRRLAELRPDVVAWWSMGGLTLTMLEAVRRRALPAVAFVHDECERSRDPGAGGWDPSASVLRAFRRASTSPLLRRMSS